MWLYEVEGRAMGLHAMGFFLFMWEYDQNQAPHDSPPSSISAISFFCLLCHAGYSLLLFSQPQPGMQNKGKPSPARQWGGTLARKVLTGGGFSGYTTRSTTPLLVWPLPRTRLQCNQNSPLNDSSNNWSSFSCKHCVSLDKDTVNTIMVPISNSF